MYSLWLCFMYSVLLVYLVLHLLSYSLSSPPLLTLLVTPGTQYDSIKPQKILVTSWYSLKTLPLIKRDLSGHLLLRFSSTLFSNDLLLEPRTNGNRLTTLLVSFFTVELSLWPDVYRSRIFPPLLSSLELVVSESRRDREVFTSKRLIWKGVRIKTRSKDVYALFW